MSTIAYEGRTYACEAGESVLDCLMRHGVLLPSSCRNGICQTCMMHAISGDIPEESQKGLKDTLKVQGYFLACVCRPRGDMEIRQATVEGHRHAGTVSAKEQLNAQVMRLRIQPGAPFPYRAGQFINLLHGNAVRSYSLASLPGEGEIELHVRQVPSGLVSSWVHRELAVDDGVEFFGPAGDCFYVPGKPEQPLLLVGTGTGLAPLYGIIRDAIAHGHTGDIRLFHGSLHRDGLYMVDTLQALAAASENIRYIPCVLHGEAPAGGAVGSIDDVVMQAMPDLAGWRVYLCGDPEIVRTLQGRIFLAGAAMQEIHADAFTFTPH
ncbi:MAG TPA: 2Fe-2S iron-sulfur cluster-binding protein [Mariprofundaceae bacterium]|nr:2Fe-2S iron-sulfur cluster-binding protein [Mariprofundaceae bacterium]